METSPNAAGFKYSAFISYAHDDEVWAKWLQSALETYRVPSRLVGTRTGIGVLTRRLPPAFRDRSDLPAAKDLGATINEALRASANLVVICSPAASASAWVNEEISAFRRLGRGDRIFCVIVAGEPNASDRPGHEAAECFPPALRFEAAADGQPGRQRLDPIAADARRGGDGRANVKLKILSALLDVGFDVLKQRELRRRNQRMAALTAGALAMMLLTTGLAINALIARKAAEQRQKEAETLVDFMLGDLNDKLRQVQRLDILEAVDSQAMTYFLASPSRKLSDQSLTLNLKALQKIGNVREDQGKLAAAMESYRAAAALGAELVRRRPGDAEHEAAYAETLHHLGNGYWFQGDLDHALESFQHAIALLERSTTARPADDRLALLANARSNAGRVREVRGEFGAAKTLYEAGLATFTTLASHDAGNVRWQSSLADSRDSLAKVALEQGQLPQAIAAYRDVLQIRTLTLQNSPGDRDLQENELISSGILGGALALCGAEDAAARYLREAVSLARKLVAFDPTQGDWRVELGKYSAQLGSVARSSGRFDEAASADREALEALSALVGSDQTNSEWRRQLVRAQLESARLQLALGDLHEADRLAQAAVAGVALERTRSAVNRNLQLLESQALTLLGEVAERRHDAAGARAYWLQARDAIATAARFGADPNFLAAWASTLLLLDDTNAAQPIVNQLAAMGYETPDFGALLALKKRPYRPAPSLLRCGEGAAGGSGSHDIG